MKFHPFFIDLCSLNPLLGFYILFLTYLKFKVLLEEFRSNLIQQCLFQIVFIVLIPNCFHSFYFSAGSCYSSKCSSYSKSSQQFLFQTAFIVLSTASLPRVKKHGKNQDFDMHANKDLTSLCKESSCHLFFHGICSFASLT